MGAVTVQVGVFDGIPSIYVVYLVNLIVKFPVLFVDTGVEDISVRAFTGLVVVYIVSPASPFAITALPA